MRTFDGNLRAYHALNARNNRYSDEQTERMAKTTTEEEQDAILKESFEHFAHQSNLYIKLGDEMGEIMGRKWWQFWK